MLRPVRVRLVRKKLMQSWSGKAIVRETPRQPVTLQLVKKSRPQNSEAKRKTTSGPYTRDVHQFPPGRLDAARMRCSAHDR